MLEELKEILLSFYYWLLVPELCWFQGREALKKVVAEKTNRVVFVTTFHPDFTFYIQYSK